MPHRKLSGLYKSGSSLTCFNIGAVLAAGDAPAELPVSSRLSLALGFENDLKISDCSFLIIGGLIVVFLSLLLGSSVLAEDLGCASPPVWLQAEGSTVEALTSFKINFPVSCELNACFSALAVFSGALDIMGRRPDLR